MTKDNGPTPSLEPKDQIRFRKRQRVSSHAIRKWLEFFAYALIGLALLVWVDALIYKNLNSSMMSAGFLLVFIFLVSCIISLLSIRAFAIFCRPLHTFILFPTLGAYLNLILILFFPVFFVFILSSEGFNFDTFWALVGYVALTAANPFTGGILPGLFFPTHRRIMDIWSPRRLPDINTPPGKSAGSKRAFTLIELLIVVAMLAIFSVSVANVLSGLAESIQRNALNQEAARLIENQVQYLRANASIPPEGEYPLSPEVVESAKIDTSSCTLLVQAGPAPDMRTVRVQIRFARPQDSKYLPGTIEAAAVIPIPKEEERQEVRP